MTRYILSISLGKKAAQNMATLRKNADGLSAPSDFMRPEDCDLGEPDYQWAEGYKHSYILPMRIGAPVAIQFGKMLHGAAEDVRVSIPDLSGNGSYASEDLMVELMTWINGQPRAQPHQIRLAEARASFTLRGVGLCDVLIAGKRQGALGFEINRSDSGVITALQFGNKLEAIDPKIQTKQTREIAFRDVKATANSLPAIKVHWAANRLQKIDEVTTRNPLKALEMSIKNSSGDSVPVDAWMPDEAWSGLRQDVYSCFRIFRGQND